MTWLIVAGLIIWWHLSRWIARFLGLYLIAWGVKGIQKEDDHGGADE